MENCQIVESALGETGQVTEVRYRYPIIDQHGNWIILCNLHVDRASFLVLDCVRLIWH